MPEIDAGLTGVSSEYLKLFVFFASSFMWNKANANKSLLHRKPF